jgi:hypothetical protein
MIAIIATLLLLVSLSFLFRAQMRKRKAKDEEISGFQQLIKDGCVYRVNGQILVDRTLYQDHYWAHMKHSGDAGERAYHRAEYPRWREYREKWLETDNGKAWKKRMGYE